MNTFLNNLSENSGSILLLLSVITLVLIIGFLVLSMRVKRIRNTWSQLLDGTQGKDIERLLQDHLAERMTLEEKLSALQKEVDVLEAKMMTSKRYLGIVRYDAFEDVGGAQSFALAIYDDKGDGVVLNSIVGRTDVRVYCKQILNGNSERNLSNEEERAIREASNSGPKSIVS